MHRYFALVLCLLASVAYAQDDNHDLSYTVGATLGERLREELPTLQIDALILGLRQAYAKEPLALDPQRMQSLLSMHTQELLSQADTHQLAKTKEAHFIAAEKAKAGVRVLSNGVIIEVLHKGYGAKPQPNSRIQVSYSGYLADGSQFDASKGPQWFNLNSVIEGWQSALLEMPVGASWRLVIPSAQAYGAEGAGDLIAPYSPLVFELQLHDTQLK